MHKNAYRSDRGESFGPPYRRGNDYYGRRFIRNVPHHQKVTMHSRTDRRDQNDQNPFVEPVRSGNVTGSWNRYEDDECMYQMCKDNGMKQCAWFYDSYNCGADRNNNGRYYDAYFGRGRTRMSSRGHRIGRNRYKGTKLARTRPSVVF